MEDSSTEGRNSLKEDSQVELHSEQKWSNDVLDIMQIHLTLLGEASQGVNLLRHRSSEDLVDQNAPLANMSRSPSVGKEKEILVDVNSNKTPMFDGWEQLLDMRTGNIYFIDWNSCKKSRFDPRACFRLSNARLPLLAKEMKTVDSQVMDLGSSNSMSRTNLTLKEEEMEVESKYTGYVSATRRDEVAQEAITDDHPSKLSCTETVESPILQQPETVMVVVGCQNCLKYVLQPKERQFCSSCGHAVCVIGMLNG